MIPNMKSGIGHSLLPEDEYKTLHVLKIFSEKIGEECHALLHVHKHWSGKRWSSLGHKIHEICHL